MDAINIAGSFTTSYAYGFFWDSEQRLRTFCCYVEDPLRQDCPQGMLY